MTESRQRARMLDRTHQPTDEEMLREMGPAREAWLALRSFLAERYPDVAPETNYGGAKYGWEVRYRKGGRPLTSLFPEQDGFTALVVLGAAEVAKAEAIAERLSPAMQRLLGGTAQLHDGRWLWIHHPDDGTVGDIRELIQLKRRPKRT